MSATKFRRTHVFRKSCHLSTNPGHIAHFSMRVSGSSLAIGLPALTHPRDRYRRSITFHHHRSSATKTSCKNFLTLPPPPSLLYNENNLQPTYLPTRLPTRLPMRFPAAYHIPIHLHLRASSKALVLTLLKEGLDISREFRPCSSVSGHAPPSNRIESNRIEIEIEI